MVKFLLLALAFGLAHAHAELEEKWVTIAITADNVDKREEGGPLRIYIHELICSEMGVTFYVKWVISGYYTDVRYCLQFPDRFLRNAFGWRPVVEFCARIFDARDSKNLISSKLKGNERLWIHYELRKIRFDQGRLPEKSPVGTDGSDV